MSDLTGSMPPGFDPGGDTPPSFDPSVRDLDADLVAFVWAKVGIKPVANMVAPGPAKPTITFTLVAETPIIRLAGVAGLAQRTYQLDFRSTVNSVPAQLCESLRASIQGFRGKLGTNIVRRVAYRRLPTGLDVAANKGSSGTYRVVAELLIWFQQPRPTF